MSDSGPTTRELEPYHFYERDWEDSAELRDWFEWEVPEQFNIASYVCDRWAREKTNTAAMYSYREDEQGETYTFRQLRDDANRFANYLTAKGIGRGDRIVVSGSQRYELMVAHVAAFKLGAISVPVSVLLGADGLEFRLRDCDADLHVAGDNVEEARVACDAVGGIDRVIAASGSSPKRGEDAFTDALVDRSRSFETVTTHAEDPATIIYTSGTTGQPKGVVHAHRHLLGILPGFLCVVGHDVGDHTINRTVVEWSWIGSLCGLVLAGWFYGQPPVAYDRNSFQPEDELSIIEEYGITAFHSPATGIRMMMQLDSIDQYDLSSVGTVASGGEALGPSVVEWIEETFPNADVVEGYGQTEAAAMVADMPAYGYPHREGHMGVPVIGTEFAIMDPETRELIEEPHTVGELAIRYEEHPQAFKKYLGRPEKINEKIHDGWLLSEDLVSQDEDGYVSFHSRKDDVIISSGYRIGPTEIEEALASHEGVVTAGVIGIPDDVRGEIPKAFVETAADTHETEAFADRLQEYVKANLAKYEYPREIEFVEELPRTTTGKVRRADLRDWEGINR